MNQEMATVILLVQGGSIFGLILCIWLGGVLIWSRRRSAREKHVERRLEGLPEARGIGKARVLRLWHDEKEITTAVPDRVKRKSLSSRLKQIHREAGFKASPQLLAIGLAGATSMACLMVFLMSNKLMFGLGALVLTPFLFWIHVTRRVKRNAELFERQLVEALGLATRSLRAGYALPAPFRLINEEMEPPISTLFGEICQQQELGVGMEDAMRQSAAKVSNSDYHMFAAAMVIQMRSGGNLADMMEQMAVVIRNRIRIHRRVRVLTSQAQFSKQILVGLPFFVFFMLNVINAEYMRPLYTTFYGRWTLVMCAVMLMLGTWMMNRIATLRF